MLAGFKAQNHPQQTGARGALDEVDDRGTEPDFVRGLEKRFGVEFSLDVAAAQHNTKAPMYFDREMDGLKQSWAGERIWCNIRRTRTSATGSRRRGPSGRLHAES